MKKLPQISAAEWEVLKVVWEQPCLCVGEMADKLPSQVVEKTVDIQPPYFIYIR